MILAPRSTDLDPKWGDLVVVYLRHTGRGRKRGLVTSMGFVEEVDSRNPVRVKTDRCPNKFHEVLEIKCRSTSMISNDIQSQSDHTRFRSILLIVFIVSNVCEGDRLKFSLLLKKKNGI